MGLPVALRLAYVKPPGAWIRTRWPTALVVARITPPASDAPPGRAASYQTSGRSHTAAGVVGHGMLIQGPEGLWHAKHGPLTKICLVCSASAAVRPRGVGAAGATLGALAGSPELGGVRTVALADPTHSSLSRAP